MKVADLTEPERKLWQAAVTGELVDLRVGKPKLDNPEKGSEWGPERTVRAEVIVNLLLGDDDAASMKVKRVRLQGARITGKLDLEAAILRCPLSLLGCSFESAVNLTEATAISVRLSGSHLPAVYANQLLTRGDLRLDKGFGVSDGVKLMSAHIGGLFTCAEGQFSNPGGIALHADRLTVDDNMFCNMGFAANGTVHLAGAHIGGQLNCSGGQFFNPKGKAINAVRLTVASDMFCDEGFSARGEVNLQGVLIGGFLSCSGGQFFNPDGPALNADGLTTDGNMFCDEGFSATGEVRMQGAHIGSQFVCTGGQFFNPDGPALNAEVLKVDQGMYCNEGFSATGEVWLPGAHIGSQFICTGGQFSNPNGIALNLERATVTGPLMIESAVLEGSLNLSSARISAYQDDLASWPKSLWLEGFVYDAIEGASANERLGWLLRNGSGYSPQIYDQLAGVYRRSGQEDDARLVLIAKQRRRSAEGGLASMIWGWLLDGLVGYGYRTWQAGLWLIGLLILGNWLFGSVYRNDLTPANKSIVQPTFQPFLYTLDLLLPVVSLHVRDAWVAHDAALWWSVGFIIVGWILATAVVLSLTGLLKRD